MKRLHLFELEDQHWFPAFLRNYGTDYLRFIANTFDIFKAVVPLMRKALRRSDHHRIIDLASGGGGPWVKLHEHLEEDFPELHVTLSDYYPNLPAYREMQAQLGPRVSYFDQPVDARAVPAQLTGFRTQFLSFHHFRPDDCVRILQNAVDARQPIGVFEVTERNVKSMLSIFFAPLAVLVFTPFIRPFKIGRILFTYIIPIVIPFVWWDGVVSVLRSYKVKEMRGLVERVKGWEAYEWHIGKVQDGPGAVLHLVGWPKDAASVRGEGEA